MADSPPPPPLLSFSHPGPIVDHNFIAMSQDGRGGGGGGGGGGEGKKEKTKGGGGGGGEGIGKKHQEDSAKKTKGAALAAQEW